METMTGTDIARQADSFLRNQLAVNTKGSYGRALEGYLKWLQAENVSGLDISFDQALTFRDLVLSRYKESSAAQHISAIKAFYKMMSDVGVIRQNVWAAVKAPRSNETVAVTKALTRRQLEKVYEKATVSGPRDLLIVRLLYEVALRREEVAELPADCLDETSDGWALRVRGKGNKAALVGITDELAAIIQAQAEAVKGSPYLFPGRQPGSHLVKNQINNILAAYGVSPHQLRHTHATDSLHSGAALQDVSRTLRHADIRTTMRYFSTRQQVTLSSSRRLNAPKGIK